MRLKNMAQSKRLCHILCCSDIFNGIFAIGSHLFAAQSYFANPICQERNPHIMYDVIIIGAGPAGSTAAKTLAELGLRVLIAEQHKLPRYKSCSGVLIKKSLQLVSQYFQEDVPLNVTCAPTENRGMIFTDDRGKTHCFAQDGLNVWRSGFDHWLAEKAAAAGAELRDEIRVLSCELSNDFVTLTLAGENRTTEQASYILDCEGSASVLRRQCLPNDLAYITTFQAFYEGTIDLDPHYFYAYLQPELSEYDAWFNVKDHLLVLGVSAKNARFIPSYYQKFLSYMGRQHTLRLTRRLKEEKWLMPHIQPGCPIHYGTGRLLFAGEAAGFLNPMGEGISAALESGYCAAAAIYKHFDNPAHIDSAYRQNTAALKAYMDRQWNFVGRISAKFREMAQ